MRLPDLIVEESDISPYDEVADRNAVNEMNLNEGDMYFKKGHAHMVVDIKPSNGTFTVEHADGEKKVRTISRQYRHWKSGQILPVQESFIPDGGDD